MVEGCEERLDRDAAAGHQLAATSADCCGERGGPAILVDADPGGVARFDDLDRFIDVALIEQTRGGALEDGQVELAVTVEVGELQR